MWLRLEEIEDREPGQNQTTKLKYDSVNYLEWFNQSWELRTILRLIGCILFVRCYSKDVLYIFATQSLWSCNPNHTMSFLFERQHGLAAVQVALLVGWV